MIEVNLLPGGQKGASKGGMSFSLPKFSLGGGGAGGPDPYVLFFAGAAIIGLGYMGWAYMSARGEHEDLSVRLEEERQDSIRFSALIEQTNRLTARRDSIAARANIIQQIDEDRYVWSHLMDEVGAAVPEFTWLREVTYMGDNPLQIRIAGRAGNPYAVTQFVRRLEASSFLMGAALETMQEQPSEENPDDLVQQFEIVVSYQSPPIDELQTVPLFEDEFQAAQQAITDPTGN